MMKEDVFDGLAWMLSYLLLWNIVYNVICLLGVVTWELGMSFLGQKEMVTCEE